MQVVNNDSFLLEQDVLFGLKIFDCICYARAIVKAMARMDKHEQWESIRKCYKAHGDLARGLHKVASMKEGQCVPQK